MYFPLRRVEIEQKLDKLHLHVEFLSNRARDVHRKYFEFDIKSVALRSLNTYTKKINPADHNIMYSKFVCTSMAF